MQDLAKRLNLATNELTESLLDAAMDYVTGPSIGEGLNQLREYRKALGLPFFSDSEVLGTVLNEDPKRMEDAVRAQVRSVAEEQIERLVAEALKKRGL